MPLQAGRASRCARWSSSTRATRPARCSTAPTRRRSSPSARRSVSGAGAAGAACWAVIARAVRASVGGGARLATLSNPALQSAVGRASHCHTAGGPHPGRGRGVPDQRLRRRQGLLLVQKGAQTRTRAGACAPPPLRGCRGSPDAASTRGLEQASCDAWCTALARLTRRARPLPSSLGSALLQVLMEMGPEFSTTVPLVSMNSISKGFFGECGR